MTERTQTTDEVMRTRKSLYRALATLMIVGALAGVFIAVGGVDVVADLIVGGSDSGDIIAPMLPDESAEDVGQNLGESDEPTASADATPPAADQ